MSPLILALKHIKPKTLDSSKLYYNEKNPLCHGLVLVPLRWHWELLITGMYYQSCHL